MDDFNDQMDQDHQAYDYHYMRDFIRMINGQCVPARVSRAADVHRKSGLLVGVASMAASSLIAVFRLVNDSASHSQAHINPEKGRFDNPNFYSGMEAFVLHCAESLAEGYRPLHQVQPEKPVFRRCGEFMKMKRMIWYWPRCFACSCPVALRRPETTQGVRRRP